MNLRAYAIAALVALTVSPVEASDRNTLISARNAILDACHRLGDLAVEAEDANRTPDALAADRLSAIGEKGAERLEVPIELQSLRESMKCDADRASVGTILRLRQEVLARMLRVGECVSIEKFLAVTHNKKIGEAARALQKALFDAIAILESQPSDPTRL